MKKLAFIFVLGTMTPTILHNVRLFKNAVVVGWDKAMIEDLKKRGVIRTVTPVK